MVAEFSAKPVPRPVQARLHAAERDTGNGRDLVIAEPFEVGEIDHYPVPIRQGLQCRGEIGVQLVSEYLVFG